MIYNNYNSIIGLLNGVSRKWGDKMWNEDDELDYMEIKTITGEHICCLKSNVMGYCHFFKHRGYITRSILKNHECVKKQCSFLQKNTSNPYWTAVERIQAAEKRKKETAKRLKREEEERQRELVARAQGIADELGYRLRVIRVTKTPGKKHFVLFYISENPWRDWAEFFELAREFGKTVGGRVELRHIKDIDGRYATL